MKNLIISIIVLFTFSNANAEQKIVSGKVLLNDQFAIGNVIVKAKKSKAIVSTNVDGEYSIACEKKDVLIFKAKLFGTVKKSVRGRSAIDVNMRINNKLEDAMEIVDMGYVKEESLEAVMKSIYNANDYSRFSSLDDLIRNELPFVVSRGNGSYFFRGIKSLKGSNAALLELDGVIVSDFSDVLPIQVKSIKAFQASEAVLYGSRGSNGVIIITTKNR